VKVSAHPVVLGQGAVEWIVVNRLLFERVTVSVPDLESVMFMDASKQNHTRC